MSDISFQTLAQHKKQVQKQKNIWDLFVAVWDISQIQAVCALQKECFLTEIIIAYEYFGFCIFSELSLSFLEEGALEKVGIPRNLTEEYFLNLKNYFLYDLPIVESDSVSFEIKLNHFFVKEFSQRCFCSHKDDEAEIGLFLFPASLTLGLRGSLLKEDVPENLSFFQKEVQNFRMRLNENPLYFITQRLDCFVSFSGDEKSLCFIKENWGKFEEKKQQLAAMITLFLILQEDRRVSAQGYVSLHKITQVLAAKEILPSFDLMPLRQWMACPSDKTFKTHVASILEQALYYHLVFQIPRGCQGRAYGLSEKGYLVMRPFRSLVLESLQRL